jgi:hypothetical protein
MYLYIRMHVSKPKLQKNNYKKSLIGKNYYYHNEGVKVLLGLLINEREKQEIEYLLKREMDEILFDLKDGRIDHIVKRAMDERYKILFSLFKRIASHKECLKYIKTDKDKKTPY